MFTRPVLFLSFVVVTAAGIVSLAAGASAPADEPRIVSSIPADGADDVPITLDRLMIVFDRDMKENSWSLIEHAHLPFPPTAEGEAASWLDQRTFVLKLQALAPETTYAVQLNSDRKKGFMSAGEFVPLPATVITFTTGPGEEKDASRSRMAPGATRRRSPDRMTPPGAALQQQALVIRPGWIFHVTRTTALKATVQGGGEEFSIQQVVSVEFTETVKKSDGPRITEAHRQLIRAEIKGRDPETGELMTQPLLPAGNTYSVVFGPQETTVLDAQTGREADETAQDLLSVPLTLDIWPSQVPRPGQEWTYEGEDLTRRLGDLGVQGGRLTLTADRVEGGAGGAGGLRTAFMKGRLESKIDLDGQPADYSAAVQIDLPVDIGVPFMTKFEGPVTFKVEEMDEWTGQPVVYTVEGEVAFLQIAEPAEEVMRAAGATLRPSGVDRRPAEEDEPRPPQRAQPPADDRLPAIAFHRVAEPRENAFTILVPKDWRVEGGIFRVNAVEAGGPLNAIEAKVDIAFKSDEKGTVMLHRLPDIVYAHAGIGGGYFPPGSVYQGAQVMALLSAEEFLQAMAPNLRPQAMDVRFLEVRKLPELMRVYEEACRNTNAMLMQIGGQQSAIEFDAAGAMIEYVEDGVRYRELLVTAILNMKAALVWGNKDTLAFRAPAAEFDHWRGVLDVMRYSVQLNPQWVMAEAGGQRDRCKIVLDTQREIHRISREIADNQRRTHEEINYENYLVLTDQEDYVNPFTNEVERDTSEYRYRWTTPDGQYYFTDNPNDNPNLHKPFNRDDFKLTPVRPR